MYSRRFHMLVTLLLLVSLILLLRASPAQATQGSTLPRDSFQPSKQSFAVAHRVSTAAIPQVKDTVHETVITHSKPSTHTTLTLTPALQNVVNVPPASGTNPSALNGITNIGSTPTDSNGAGGTDNYLETVNGQFAIYDRSGNLQYTTTYQSWFANVEGGATQFYDPNVVWDAFGSRFIFIVNTSKSLLLSVAQQTTATSADFCNYSFPTLTGLGADFDKLGVNNAGVYFSANEVDNMGVVNNILFYANRSQLESCVQKVTYTTWSKLTNPDKSIAQAIVPAVQNTSSTGGVEYLVNSHPSGACALTLWTLTPGSTPTLSRTTVFTQCYSPPPDAPQAGSSATIYTGDCSLSHVSYVNGLLTLTLQGSYNWGDGNGPVGIIEWFVLNPSTSKASNQGAFGTPGYWLFYPAVVKTFSGHMLFVYDASGPTIDPSIWYVNQTFTGTQAIAQGASNYGASGSQPWGDYQSAWLDAGGSNHNAVWITGMYANGTNSWGTKFALVTP